MAVFAENPVVKKREGGLEASAAVEKKARDEA
jgi:hypothetical protein